MVHCVSRCLSREKQGRPARRLTAYCSAADAPPLFCSTSPHFHSIVCLDGKVITPTGPGPQHARAEGPYGSTGLCRVDLAGGITIGPSYKQILPVTSYWYLRGVAWGRRWRGSTGGTWSAEGRVGSCVHECVWCVVLLCLLVCVSCSSV